MHARNADPLFIADTDSLVSPERWTSLLVKQTAFKAAQLYNNDHHPTRARLGSARLGFVTIMTHFSSLLATDSGVTKARTRARNESGTFNESARTFAPGIFKQNKRKSRSYSRLENRRTENTKIVSGVILY